jgi:hypothetical protein
MWLPQLLLPHTRTSLIVETRTYNFQIYQDVKNSLLYWQQTYELNPTIILVYVDQNLNQ